MAITSGDPIAVAASTNNLHLQSLNLSVLLASLPLTLLPFSLPFIAHEMGASAIAIGGLFSVYALIIAVMQPIVGRGLDRFGRRTFLIAGLLGYAFSNAIFGLASGLAGLYLAQLVQGVGSGLLWVAAMSIVSDLAPAANRGREYGRIEEMAFRGELIGTLVGLALFRLLSRADIGGGLTLIGGWRVLFLGFTAAALVAAGIVWRKVPETLHLNDNRSAKSHAALVESKIDINKKWRLPGQLRILMGIVMLSASAGALLSPILMKYLSKNVSADMFTLVLAYLPAMIAGSVLPSYLGGLSDRFGRRPPMIVALFVGGLTALAVPFVQSLWPLALLWVLEAMAFAAAMPAEEALVIDVSDSERQGTALGYYAAAAGLGGVIGPLMGGWIYDHFAAVGAFGTSALLMALSAVLILLFVREPPHSNLMALQTRKDH
jgi:DHA1 family multidrug resistance protein-like MFS transporter